MHDLVDFMILRSVLLLNLSYYRIPFSVVVSFMFPDSYKCHRTFFHAILYLLIFTIICFFLSIQLPYLHA